MAQSTPIPSNKYTVQEVMNKSFDETYNVNAVEPLTYDPTTNSLIRAYPASALNLKPYDYMSLALTDSVTETYTFKSGGSGGTTTNTIVIVYTDSGKGTISSVTKT